MIGVRELGDLMSAAVRWQKRKDRYFEKGDEPAFFAAYEGAGSDEERREVVKDAFYYGEAGDAREALYEFLDALGSGPRGEGRLSQALELLGECRHLPSGWRHALRYLHKGTEEVRASAAIALMHLKEERATQDLRRRLGRERNDNVKRWILRALGTSGVDDPEVADLLLRFTRRGRPSLLRINATIALKEFTAHERVGEELLAAFRTESHYEVRSAFALILGYHRVDAAIPALEKSIAKVSQTLWSDIVEWAMDCIEGKIEEPSEDFDKWAASLTREGY
jgi:hypothetical protein